MPRTLNLAAAGAAALAGATLLPAVPAQAATLTPVGPVILSVTTGYSGVVCTSTFNATVSAGGTITVATSGRTLGAAGLCALVRLTSNWTIASGAYTPGAPGSAVLSLTGLNTMGLSGSCTQGATPVTGVWTNAPVSTATLSATIPGSPAPCTFNIQFTSTPNLTAS